MLEAAEGTLSPVLPDGSESVDDPGDDVVRYAEPIVKVKYRLALPVAIAMSMRCGVTMKCD